MRMWSEGRICQATFCFQDLHLGALLSVSFLPGRFFHESKGWGLSIGWSICGVSVEACE